MSDPKTISEMLRTLDPDALAKVVVPTPAEIRAALNRSREQFRKASGSPRSSVVGSGLRYR